MHKVVQPHSVKAFGKNAVGPLYLSPFSSGQGRIDMTMQELKNEKRLNLESMLALKFQTFENISLQSA